MACTMTTETVYEKHRRLMEEHFFDGTNNCWCNPTWEKFTECDGTEFYNWTHHMTQEQLDRA